MERMHNWAGVPRPPDLFRDDPISRPLTYPGRIPGESGVLIGGAFTPMRPVAGRPAAEWIVQGADVPVPLAGILERLDCAPMSARSPSVAVGSNASPSQLLRKFTMRSVRPVVPMTLTHVSGIAAGVSAHISKPGYIPAAPAEAPGEVARLFTLWLDSEQLRALDATEPNYRRRELPSGRFPVRLESGILLSRCSVYVGKHGCLTDAAGHVRRLISQESLIGGLLAESPGLRELCGTTVQEFLVRARDDGVRNRAAQLFALEKRVRAQPALEASQP